MFKVKFLIFILLITVSMSASYSQEIREESSLNYTYIGPMLSFSNNSAEYSDWIDDEQRTEKVSGTTYAGGVTFKILAANMCGDFQAKYSYSSYDTTLTCLEFLLAGKYLYKINDFISAGGGLGIYMETPPSSSEHNGSAGLYFPLTTMFSTSVDTRLFIDIFAKYGTFAMGDDTKFNSFGCDMGFVFKIGRI